MQTKHLCVFIHIWTKGEVGAVKPGLNPLVNNFYWPFQGSASFVDHLCFLCFVFLMLSRMFIAALWSPAGKGLTSWLLLVMFIVLRYFLGHVWHLSVSFPDLSIFLTLKERPEIFAKTAMPQMHWPIKQTVHIRNLTI